MLYVVYVYVNDYCFINCYFTSLHVPLAPSRITNVTVSKDVRQEEPILRVNWTAPQSDVNLSQYQVQSKRNGTTLWSSQVTVTPPETTAILSDLTAGTAYNVRVRGYCTDHHSSACVRFMNSGMLGGCQYDFTSRGVTIVGQGSRDLFLLYILIWCNILVNLVCQVRIVWTTVLCVPVGGIGVEVEVLI